MMLAALLLFAVQTIHYHGELPDAEHAWCVHDLNRPNPAKVSAEAGRVPSDATVLFDGTAESVAANWYGKIYVNGIEASGILDGPCPPLWGVRPLVLEKGRNTIAFETHHGTSGQWQVSLAYDVR